MRSESGAQTPLPILSEGRSRGDRSWSLLALLVGVCYLALVGFAVTVTTIYGWIF